MYKSVAIMALLVVAASAAPAPQESSAEESSSIFQEAYGVYSSCASEASLAVCLKLKALKFVDRAARSADIQLLDGLKIVQSEDAKNSRAENARSIDIEKSLPTEINAKEEAIDQAIIDRTAKFLSTHTVELSLPEQVSRSLDEARGKKKKVKSLIMPLLALLKLKLALLVPLALGGLALLAFKAFVASKIALIVSGIVALNKLLAGKHQSYEVVAHPVHSHSYEEHHDHHGWARSSGSDLAYSAYKSE